MDFSSELEARRAGEVRGRLAGNLGAEEGQSSWTAPFTCWPAMLAVVGSGRDILVWLMKRECFRKRRAIDVPGA